MPKFKQIGGVSVSFDLPDVVVVLICMNGFPHLGHGSPSRNLIVARFLYTKERGRR